MNPDNACTYVITVSPKFPTFGNQISEQANLMKRPPEELQICIPGQASPFVNQPDSPAGQSIYIFVSGLFGGGAREMLRLAPHYSHK